MSSSANSVMLDTFRSKLMYEWRQKNRDHHRSIRPFVRTSLLEEWMAQRENETSKTNGERLIDEVDPMSRLGNSPASVLKGDKSCILVLSCLLHPIYGKKYEYGKLIYIFQSAGIIDKHLQNAPSSFAKLRRDLKFKRVPGVEAIIEHFEQKMWEYCPVHLEDGLNMDFGSKLFLPYFIRDKVGSGGTATVFKVRLQQEFVSKEIKNYLGNPLKDPDHGEYYEFALKSFSEEQFETYKKELEAFDGLRNEPGMVRSFGYYSCSELEGVNTFNILLEYGKTDLYESFFGESPPQLPAEIISYWKKICNVAEALKTFHSLQHQEQFYHGWHGDVKPNNILLVQSEWKLADFGFSEFSKRDENVQHLPKIIMRGGTETYGAPECAQKKTSESQEENAVPLYQTIDTWSIGCVLSETATWVVKGGLGIYDYQILRQLNGKKQTHRNITDAFHDGFDVLPEIRDWHKILKSVRRISDSITPEILDLVDEKMLIKDPQARISSGQLCERLREIVTSAEEAENTREKSGKSREHPPEASLLDRAKLALWSTEMARESTVQKTSGHVIKVDHVKDGFHSTQHLRVPSSQSILRSYSSISQRRETLERDFHDHKFEVTMGAEGASPAERTIFTGQQTRGRADQARLHLTAPSICAERNRSQGLSLTPATDHTVVTNGDKSEKANDLVSKADHQDLMTRSSRSLDGSQQSLASPCVGSSASSQQARLKQSSLQTSTQSDSPSTQSQASQLLPVLPLRSSNIPPHSSSATDDVLFLEYVGRLDKSAVDLCRLMLAEDLSRAKLVDQHKYTPIMIAAKRNHLAIVDLLLPYSDLGQRDVQGDTVLHHMIRGLNQYSKKETQDGFLSITKEILRHADDQVINMLGEGNRSPLCCCARFEMPKTAKLLMDQGAWIHPPTGSQGRDAFEEAVEHDTQVMVEFFLEQEPGLDRRKEDKRPKRYQWFSGSR